MSYDYEGSDNPLNPCDLYDKFIDRQNESKHLGFNPNDKWAQQELENYWKRNKIMTNYILKGMAELEEYVEVELTAETEEEARDLATKELLQTHPEYIDVAWASVNAQ